MRTASIRSFLIYTIYDTIDTYAYNHNNNNRYGRYMNGAHCGTARGITSNKIEYVKNRMEICRRERARERDGNKKKYFHINKIQFRMDLIELYLINFFKVNQITRCALQMPLSAVCIRSPIDNELAFSFHSIRPSFEWNNRIHINHFE